MEKQDTTKADVQLSVIEELRQFGFQQNHIQKAVKFTKSTQLAAEIIVKLMQEGDDADLSMYAQSVKMAQEKPVQLQQLEEKPLVLPVKPKMLFLVNGQLKMGKGKVCAQVGHGVIGAYMQIQEEAKFDERQAKRLSDWEREGQAKVVVKCPTEAEMLEIQKKIGEQKSGVNLYLVEDAGHTQIKAGSKTVLAIGPAYSGEIDPWTKHLKLA